MKIKYLYILFLLSSSALIGQDTSFVASHHFESPVRNVFKNGQELYAKTGDGVYKKEENGWIKQDLGFKKPFVFYENGFYEADYLPNKYIYDPTPIKDLIPKRSLSQATFADFGDHFYVCVSGSLFEYAINRLYRHTYVGKSIRHIFQSSKLKVVSTYSGIYINDTIKAKQPEHSNGNFCQIGDQYYLCSDHLYRLDDLKEFQLIASGDNVFAGNSRKLLEFKGHVYSLNTKSLNLMDSLFQLLPIHQGYEYYDMEVVADKLLFCTQSGDVFEFDGNEVTKLLHLNTRIRDIYTDRKLVYLSSDEGVYTFTAGNPKTLEQRSSVSFAVMCLVDPQRNTWISTENGLYLQPENGKELIPFIPGVEFNRGALNYYNDSIYAGSIEGVFVIDTYHVIKNFLPKYHTVQKAQDQSEKITLGLYILGFLGIVTLAIVGILMYRRKRFRVVIIQKSEEKNTFSLEEMGESIKNFNIHTVEALAEHYKTNAVQLNRIFKNFDTTPGKFMKTVKLDFAKQLLLEKVPMEDVVYRVGYSAQFIKKELQIP